MLFAARNKCKLETKKQQFVRPKKLTYLGSLCHITTVFFLFFGKLSIIDVFVIFVFFSTDY